jgi:hypothetical protein
MSKLFKLREWLTIEEAAEHLTGVLGESVLVKDIYRLALDGYLKLSINIVNGTQVYKGKYIKPEEVEWEEFPTQIINDKIIDSITIPDSLYIDQNRFLRLDEKVSSIRNVWDLPMLGGERLDIEHYYQQLTGGPAVTLSNLDGAFLEKGEVVCQLLESWEENEYQSGSLAQQRDMESHILKHNLPSEEASKIRSDFKKKRNEFLEKLKSQTDEENYYPAAGLPEEGVLVVRTQAIIDFLNSLQGDTERPIVTKERQTLLVIIAALCNEAGIDYQQRGIASAIQCLTETIGAPISDDTIRKVLNQIDNALESRSK